MSQQNVEMLKQSYQAFGRGDIPAVMEIMTPETEWIIPAGNAAQGGTYRGPDKIVEGVFMPIGDLYDDFEVKVREFVDGGNRVIMLGNYSGKGKATGKPLDSPFVHVAEVRNGKVTRFEEFSDTALFNAALGK